MEKIEPIYSSVANTSNKKYLTPQEYKKRLNKNIETKKEDAKQESTPKPVSTNKYLSPEEFKKRLKGK